MVAIERARATKRKGKVRVSRKPDVKCSQAIKDEIIQRQSSGEPIYLICKEAHMPALHTVYDELERDPAFATKFARARATAFDLLAAECLEIADTQEEATETTVSYLGKSVKTLDAIGHRRLKIETRLRLLAKWDPQRYGEKLEVAGGLTHQVNFAEQFAQAMARMSTNVEEQPVVARH